MRRLRLILVPALLCLWVPATSWCLLESLGWADAGACGTHQADEGSRCDHGCTGPCATFASGGLHCSDARVNCATPAAAVAAIPTCAALRPENSTCGREESERAPPGLAVTWQFATRAAAPARAPSART